LSFYLLVSNEINSLNCYGKNTVLSVSGDFGIVNQIEFQGRSFAGASLLHYRVVHSNDIVYTKSPLKACPYGIVKASINLEGIVSSLYGVYKPKPNLNSMFLQSFFDENYRLNSYLRALVNKGAKNTLLISDESALEGQVRFSDQRDEQDKIGLFFSSISRLVALHQRKCEKLQSLKKALLEKMFPSGSSLVPALRFKGFTDPWEQRKLGSTTKVTMGQSPDGATYTDNPRDHILVQGNADMENHKVVPRVWTTQVTKTAESGDIILSVRAPVGAVGKTDYDVVLGRGVSGVKGNDFIYQSLLRMDFENCWDSVSTGSTFDSINSGDISNAILYIPGKEEQLLIGRYLSLIDSSIVLHQRECEKLQNLKKALLEKMFA
jgi:type I restriction enzyme S subunit